LCHRLIPAPPTPFFSGGRQDGAKDGTDVVIVLPLSPCHYCDTTQKQEGNSGNNKALSEGTERNLD